MRKTKHLLPILGLGLLTCALPETALAQRGRSHRTERVVVVKRAPHKVVVRKAHVRYAGKPRWGASIAALPSTHITVSFRGSNFFYADGIYYTRRSNSYVVVRPLRGMRIKSLPVGHLRVHIGPRTYFYYYGTFYVQTASSTPEYIVVDPPVGAVIDALPDGYEVRTVDGNEYYYLEGVFYAEVDAPEYPDQVGYQVVQL